MRTVWTVPPNIAQTLLESPEIQMFLTSNELPETADDPRQRLTEFTHALGALSRNIGRTFGSVDAANRDLFGGSAGTVPVALRLTVLRAIVTEVDDRTPHARSAAATVVDQLGAYVYALLDLVTAPSSTSAVVAGTASSRSRGRRSVRRTNSPLRARAHLRPPPRKPRPLCAASEPCTNRDTRWSISSSPIICFPPQTVITLPAQPPRR